MRTLLAINPSFISAVPVKGIRALRIGHPAIEEAVRYFEAIQANFSLVLTVSSWRGYTLLPIAANYSSAVNFHTLSFSANTAFYFHTINRNFREASSEVSSKRMG
jgi:hypothetical protein